MMGGTGSIFFGAVEGSNVNLTEEMVSMILSKASVRANLAALKTQDEVLGEIVDLRG
jgi:flagellar basal-body rod protein FlgG